jgi:hypothetical protein
LKHLVSYSFFFWFIFYFSGLAIRDFWQVDDRTVVFVADPNFGKDDSNMLHSFDCINH